MINITAPINNLGYGVASYNIIKHLASSGEDVQLIPIGTPEPLEGSEFLKSIMYRQSVQDSPSVKIWHQNDIHHHIGKGTHIGFPIFELETFSDNELWSMAHNERLFVCSEWAKRIVLDHLDWIDVRVVPLGVDSDVFVPVSSARQQTIFFNCGKWEIRKGHDILVECFNSAFEFDDNVELWMMCDNPFYSPEQQQEWINLYKNSKLGSKVRIIPRQKDHIDVYNVMKQADCGVFPSRAEGWNLELLEMMSCGKHVISTDYSAHTEFCNADNCNLVDITNLEPAQDGVWFHGHGKWASIGSQQKDQIVEHMRKIHRIKQEGDLPQNIEGIKTARQFSWQNSAKKFKDNVF